MPAALGLTPSRSAPPPRALEPAASDGLIDMTEQSEIGLTGLGTMGQSLALNIADHGFALAVHNRTADKTKAFLAERVVPPQRVAGAATLAELVGQLQRPRAIISMVPAGPATDAQIEALAPLLEPGDVIVDAGNAHYLDTMRRERQARERGLGFVGAGVSGGEEGARHGPSIMAGGTKEAVGRVAPVLAAIAAKVDGEPCYAHLGPNGAGHFVKMVHNGIEYADMQLIAEIYALMKRGLGLDHGAMQAAFAGWNKGELDSYLIEITADIMGKRDPETGQPMVEVIRDAAGQKGTGGWTVASALELGVAIPSIVAAVEARTLSALKAEREHAALRLSGAAGRLDGPAERWLPALEAALLAAKIGAYAQGFALIDAAAKAYDWPLDRAKIARIWRGGCIIRARLLRQIAAAYERDAGLANLLLDPAFGQTLERADQSWREVAAGALLAGIPVPALTAALTYYDSYRSASLPANLIQAQRDYFGAHTYERIDREGRFHSDWAKL